MGNLYQNKDSSIINTLILAILVTLMAGLGFLILADIGRFSWMYLMSKI